MKPNNIGVILIVLFVSAQSYILPESSIESSETNENVGTDYVIADSDEQSSEVESTAATKTMTTTNDPEAQYLCECSNERADDSDEKCANMCTTALATNQFEVSETTTIRPVTDDTEFEIDDDTTSTPEKRSGWSFSINGMRFGASEENVNLIHPNDIAALKYYRHAFDKFKQGDDTNFEQIQNRVRKHLLKTYGWNLDDVERLLQWKWLPRDKNGFRVAGLPLQVPIPKDGKVYSAVGGISFHRNGSFWFNLMETKDQPALFNSDDVKLVMKKGITSAAFSLDPPLASQLPHPFQKATWSPHDTLVDTDFLSTLLHVDLWLKSMNIRTEMSARFPFDVRPIRENSSSAPSNDLFQRLFSHNDVDNDELFSSTRTWIQSGPIKYNRIEEDDITTYVLGSPNMEVKYESYVRQVKNNKTGGIDTYLGGTSPQYDHFTTVATKNYNEFGNYFPELLRLGELSKLVGVALIFQHHYRELQKIVSVPSADLIARILNSSNLRGQVFGGVWPFVTDLRVENTLDQLILEQGFQLSHKHIIRNVATVRVQIREQLIKIQNDKIKQIAEAISKEFNISANAISSTAIDSYLRNAYPSAENALLEEIITGIATRIKEFPPVQLRLYETMSQSEYDVGNKIDELPASAQLSVGKRMIMNQNSTNVSSCYYIPTTIIRVMRNHGKYVPIRGGIKMQPLLKYDDHLLNSFYPWNFQKVLSYHGYHPRYPMVGQFNVDPNNLLNGNIEFRRVSFKTKNNILYGPQYTGTTDLANYKGWDTLIEKKRATINDKNIISGMSENEGKLESVQSYDSEIVSAGAMQKTINSKGNGEFPQQVWQFKEKYPKLYQDLFEAHGWKVKEEKEIIKKNVQGNKHPQQQRIVYSMTYNEISGQDLKTAIRKDFQAKEVKKARSEPLEALVKAISSEEFQEMQVVAFVDRLNKQVLPIKPTGFQSHTLGEYLQSNLGRALALDHHVNRPGYVKDDFGAALQNLFTKHPKLSKNPNEWGENREKYEAELVEYYGTNRRGTHPEKRYKELKEKF